MTNLCYGVPYTRKQSIKNVATAVIFQDYNATWTCGSGEKKWTPENPEECHNTH